MHSYNTRTNAKVNDRLNRKRYEQSHVPVLTGDVNAEASESMTRKSSDNDSNLKA